MYYKEYTPTSILAPFVESFWVLETDDSIQDTQRIIPYGKPELIIHYKGESFIQIDGQEWGKQPQVLFAGHRMKFFFVRPGVKSSMIGVRFKEESGKAFFKCPMSESTNLMLDLYDWDSSKASFIESEMLAAANEKERLNTLANFLECEIGLFQKDPLISGIVDKIKLANGNIDIKNLSKEFNIGERKLERNFLSLLGVSPKQFARMIRFKAVTLDLENEQRDLVEISHENGFYDQSHFNREFKSFSGLTPKNYLKENHQMSNLLN